MRKLPYLTLLMLLAVADSGVAQDMEMSEAEAQAISKALDGALGALKGGRYEEAITFLEPLSRRPDAPDQVHALLGAAYVEASRPQQALATLERLIESHSDDPAVLYNAGRAALAIGRNADGERYLGKAAALAPGSPAARLLGLIRIRQGRILSAYQLLAPLAFANPSDSEVRIAAASAAIQLQRTAEAEQLLSDLPQTDPVVRLLWGRLLLLKEEPHTALSIVEPLTDSPAAEALSTDIRRLLAEIHLEIGDTVAARQLLSDLPLNLSTALKLAQATAANGDLETAIHSLEPFREPLLEGDGEDIPPTARRMRANVAQELGLLLVKTARHGEAVPVLEAATRLDPQASPAWQGLEAAYTAVGRTRDAERARDRLTSLKTQLEAAGNRQANAQDLDDATGRELRKARALVGEGRFEAALGVVRTELALVPDDPRPRLAESRILLLLGRNEEALEAVERALSKAGDSADAWYQRGAVKLAGEDLTGAEQDLRHALELDEGHTGAMNDLAVLLIVRGERDEARSLLQRVLSVNPNDRGAAQNLARLDRANQG